MNFFKLMLILSVGLFFANCGGVKYATKIYEKEKQNKPYDVVIVPGVPYNDTSGLGQIFAARILWAKYLYDSGFTKNIIFSGAAVGSPYYEGAVMKIIADSMGVPANHTFAEIKAEHSTENAYYGWLMAKQMGYTKIALATDPFQTKMLKGFLKKRCGNMPKIPVVFPKIDPQKNRTFTLPRIDPSSAFVKDFVPLAQRESFWERFRGTRGKHIKF